MEKIWTDAPLLYFHFNSANGCFASLPMRRVLKNFLYEFKGIPGTRKDIGISGLMPVWRVPGYQCLGCAKVFFAATRDGLKHECMNHGGVISESASMAA
jgi:hypothetical protein